MKLTKTHKIRLFLGVNGQLPSGKYSYTVPNWGGLKTQKLMHKFMFYIGNPMLNFLLGTSDAKCKK